jgi:hypothetical protein
LYIKRLGDWLQHSGANTDVEQERDNIKNILREIAEESLGRLTVTHKRKFLMIWDNEIKEVSE